VILLAVLYYLHIRVHSLELATASYFPEEVCMRTPTSKPKERAKRVLAGADITALKAQELVATKEERAQLEVAKLVL
jgi:hypothetical protein